MPIDALLDADEKDALLSQRDTLAEDALARLHGLDSRLLPRLQEASERTAGCLEPEQLFFAALEGHSVTMTAHGFFRCETRARVGHILRMLGKGRGESEEKANNDAYYAGLRLEPLELVVEDLMQRGRDGETDVTNVLDRFGRVCAIDRCTGAWATEARPLPMFGVLSQLPDGAGYVNIACGSGGVEEMAWLRDAPLLGTEREVLFTDICPFVCGMIAATRAALRLPANVVVLREDAKKIPSILGPESRGVINAGNLDTYARTADGWASGAAQALHPAGGQMLCRPMIGRPDLPGWPKKPEGAADFAALMTEGRDVLRGCVGLVREHPSAWTMECGHIDAGGVFIPGVAPEPEGGKTAPAFVLRGRAKHSS